MPIDIMGDHVDGDNDDIDCRDVEANETVAKGWPEDSSFPLAAWGLWVLAKVHQTEMDSDSRGDIIVNAVSSHKHFLHCDSKHGPMLWMEVIQHLDALCCLLLSSYGLWHQNVYHHVCQ